MKVLLALIFLIISSAIFSQTTEEDTSLYCVAKWNKGEEKVLHITRNKDSFESGKTKSTFELSFEAHISILDSSSDGYRIQWVFHLPEEYKKANPGIAEAMPVYEGLKMTFTTSVFGEFKDLLNWEEVKDAYVAMMYQSIPKPISDSTKTILTKSIGMFNSKQMVESALIREIQFYYSQFGSEFSINGITGKSFLQLPFGGEPLLALVTQQITDYNKVQKYFTATYKQETDMKAAGSFFETFFKEMGIPEDSVKYEIEKMLETFELSDINSFQASITTGWITNMSHKRTASTGNMKQVESFLFELKDVKK
ncbi:MAG: hypothetical protein KBF82_00040 [Chitinophagaceae bacterium]|nr:hypothetical protein [Chitinophagaceae bacterium]